MKAGKTLAATLLSLMLAGIAGTAYASEPTSPVTFDFDLIQTPGQSPSQVEFVVDLDAGADSVDGVVEGSVTALVDELLQDANDVENGTAAQAPTQVEAVAEADAGQTAVIEAVEESDSADVPANVAEATSDPAAPAIQQTALTAVIDVNGTQVPYVDTHLAATAPQTGAGVWLGNDSTTDGSWCYFIGHNPGPFTCVMYLENGSPVTVYDRNGNSKTYFVKEIFEVPNTTKWEEVEAKVTSYGESAILQTCDFDKYRIVIAA